MVIAKYKDYSFIIYIQSHTSILSNTFKLTGNFELILDLISIKVIEICLTLKFRENLNQKCIGCAWFHLDWNRKNTQQNKQTNNNFLCRTNMKHFKSVSVCISSHKHAPLHQILGPFALIFLFEGKKMVQLIKQYISS